MLKTENHGLCIYFRERPGSVPAAPFQIMYSTTQSKNWKRTLTERVAVDATAGERISTDTLVGERVSADALAGERVGVERMRVGAAV